MVAVCSVSAQDLIWTTRSFPNLNTTWPRFNVAYLRCVPLVIVICAGQTNAAGESPGIHPSVKSSRSGRWLVQETENFRICCLPSLPNAERLPSVCEVLRRQLQETWFGRTSAEWSPKCEIVVFPTVQEYRRNLGPGSEQSSGCASIDIEHQRIIKRRIDLRSDADDWVSAALPHELTHVIVADRFTKRQIPRWADEGMAILAESADKRARRAATMQRAFVRQRPMTVGELLAVAQYPSSDRRDAFLGQSASLVSYLLEQGSPDQFFDFVEQSASRGYERALADVYEIASRSQFEVGWQAQMFSRSESAELLASRIEGVTSRLPAN